tara:strand:+ start:290 stop:418 length:129 start_codon:yes stop_codon:yes gene_type:complete
MHIFQVEKQELAICFADAVKIKEQPLNKEKTAEPRKKENKKQ